MSDEHTPSLVVGNLRPDHVGGSAAMVIDGKDATAPEARTWPNFPRWAAMSAVVEAARFVCVESNPDENARRRRMLRDAIDALDVVEKRG